MICIICQVTACGNISSCQLLPWSVRARKGGRDWGEGGGGVEGRGVEGRGVRGGGRIRG